MHCDDWALGDPLVGSVLMQALGVGSVMYPG